ncbi:MAG: hypothetical protein IPI13_03375 [Actinomycetales bacterium]|jgi:hypothetical protein|uniref:Uncharacterized protein n=1 Tax=Candidatus Phosphoribacter hodrii TaxID=2953743 RepID=A0A935CE39_9MICO|nr:hypothetical protein [Candidatus Phosphoribacter hodrii]MBP8838835.1 hypothetical protein [Dermatophilaceae bacterium]OPZ53634.1 MAG: hypothetical protein BWY91_01890 [bacterium ADurb.BinA028]MBK7272226.1 hypothetical protein [Candidatus Phosphoribacter hodrii]HOA02765.1 hypothetical protein [Dermatophilaceae bacterium]
MNVKKISIAAASVAAVAALAIGGSAIANAADNPTPTTTSSATSTQGTADSGTTGTQGKGQRGGTGATGQQGSQDTPVTGDEAAKVSAAVTAKDSTVTVTSVRKDPDGSYDVLGTKAGANVMFDVSADLATITENAGGPGGGKGGGMGGASQDTPVTGDEAAKVSAAVTAKDSTVTVTSVRKDPDGSYDVLGTKAGANVMFDVSADLATITENAGGPGGMGGGKHGAPGAADSTQTAPSATSSS